MNASRILAFEPGFADALPETHSLLRTGNLTLHFRVSSLVLHGSRGLAGNPRPDSDIDLSLIVRRPRSVNMERELREVLNATIDHWLGTIQLDLAVIFDVQDCGLKCFEHTMWNEQVCQSGWTDCFGLYKTQKGFHGLVTNAGIEVKRMYPCLKIWRRR